MSSPAYKTIQDSSPGLLESLHEECRSKICKKDFEGGLEILKRSEDLLEKRASGRSWDILATLHNSALCYQRLGNLEKCALYLDACLFNIKRLVAESSRVCVKKLKYACRTHIQYCAVVSQLGSHEEALKHGKLATKTALNLINSTMDGRNTYKRKKDMRLVELASPALKTLRKFTQKEEQPSTQHIRSALGVKTLPEWTHGFSFADLISIQPFNSAELQKGSLSSELSKDVLIFKVCLLAVSYFCTATELSYLKRNCEKAFKKALSLLRAFMPADSVLLMHVNESYEKSKVSEEIIRDIQPPEEKQKTKKQNFSVVCKRSVSIAPLESKRCLKKRRRSFERPKSSSELKKIYQPRMIVECNRNIRTKLIRITKSFDSK